MLLITGGSTRNSAGTSGLTSVEVVSPSGSLLPCSVPHLPASRWYHTQDGQEACGGSYLHTDTYTNCVSLTATGWTTSHELVGEREGHVSWSSPDGLLLMGGLSNIVKTELLSDNSSSSSPSFRLEYGTRYVQGKRVFLSSVKNDLSIFFYFNTFLPRKQPFTAQFSYQCYSLLFDIMSSVKLLKN